MRFRLIKYRKFSGALNMALDEAILEAVRDGKSDATIRFFGWEPTALTIGYFQGIENEVDLELAAQQRIDVVRRITGGGAVLHEHEITYSVIAPATYYSKDIIKSYEQICSKLVKALSFLGISAEFKPINDVMVNGSKISGSAQTRKYSVLLQHGTLLVKADAAHIFSLLKGRVVKSAYTASNKKPVTSVSEYVDATREDVLDALERAFSEHNEIVEGTYSEEELKRANILAETKYGTKDWNHMR